MYEHEGGFMTCMELLKETWQIADFEDGQIR